MVTLLAAAEMAGAADDPYASARERMVERQLENRGIANPTVLAAMRAVPRHRFVPDEYRRFAYDDNPLPIGHDQTISQPYIVALMTEALRPQPDDRVLEIGTGSGYQAAVLAEIVAEVYTIEIVTPLARRSADVLRDLGYANVQVRAGDGYRGWPDQAPFDKIIVTAAPDRVPRPLLDQLAPGGLLVVPEGEGIQTLVLYERRLEDDPDGRPVIDREPLLSVRFVPMTGEVEKR
ncbi:protein-L-isoaspartate(D-aspartate) O-methyltransferase [bacterium]|nr:protein-L-isoaspartate(D-aspartate) O-methyltransferase [bacterium]